MVIASKESNPRGAEAENRGFVIFSRCFSIFFFPVTFYGARVRGFSHLDVVIKVIYLKLITEESCLPALNVRRPD